MVNDVWVVSWSLAVDFEDRIALPDHLDDQLAEAAAAAGGSVIYEAQILGPTEQGASWFVAGSRAAADAVARAVTQVLGPIGAVKVDGGNGRE